MIRIEQSLRRRADALTRRLTPGKDVYRDYHEDVALYLGRHDLVPAIFMHRCAIGQARKLTTVRSELFAQDYLLALVDPAWLADVEPGCEAIASSVDRSDSGKPPPPLVIVPANRARSRSAAFRAVLEHEFVHVNQILLGLFPRTVSITRAKDAIDNYVLCARAEYEASVLEFVRWPEVFPEVDGIGIEHWCALRGYSQALERMLADIASLGVTPRRATRALDMLQAQLPDIITRMGAPKTLAPWFVERFYGHVALALSTVTQGVPGASDSASLTAAANWVQRRCKAS